MIAIDPPIANNNKDKAQSIGNFFSLPVTFKISCTSMISRLKNDTFFRFVVSLISSFMLLGLLISFLNMFSVNSIGEIPNKIKKPVIIPIQAINKMVLIEFPPPLFSVFL